MKTVKRVVFVLSACACVVANFFLSVVTLALCAQIGAWTYVTYFGLCMFLFGVTHLFILPIGTQHGFGFAFLDRCLTFDHERLSKRPWSALRRRGALVMTVAVAVILGPVFVPICFRLLSVPEHRHWGYAFGASVAAAAVWVSVYLGAVQAVIALFARLV